VIEAYSPPEIFHADPADRIIKAIAGRIDFMVNAMLEL
jgi:PIN domain nuclease of toxin-antitoxin system